MRRWTGYKCAAPLTRAGRQPITSRDTGELTYDGQLGESGEAILVLWENE